jgi:hypothetical protein
VANILNNGNWLAISITALDEPEPQPSATATAQTSVIPVPTINIPEPTSTAMLPSATPESPAQPAAPENSCPGSETHPTGQTLAQRYGVPYEEIMAWFCQNYGFGEIDLAYSLSQQSGLPVAQVFALRDAGASWGDIKKQLVPDNNENQNQGNQGNQDNGSNKPDDPKNQDKGKNKEKTPRPHP